MTATAEILDRLSTKLDDASDYRIAKELGVTRATVSRWRVGKGSLGDESAIAAAEILGEDPRVILTLIAGERAHSERAKALYKQIAASIGKSAATILVALGMGFFGQIQQVEAADTTARSMDYANLWGRWAGWIKKQLFALFWRRSAAGEFAAA